MALSNSELLTFSEIQDGDRRNRIFFGHSGMLIVPYLCSVPNLVQIYVIVRRSFDDVTRINFRFRSCESSAAKAVAPKCDSAVNHMQLAKETTWISTM